MNVVGPECLCRQHADCVVAAMATLVMAITWDAWENFFIQTAFAVLIVVTLLLKMR